MDSKEKIFNEFFDLLCEKFGGSTKMLARFRRLCGEAGSGAKGTHFSRLGRVELSLLKEAMSLPKALTAEEFDAKYPPCYTVD